MSTKTCQNHLVRINPRFGNPTGYLESKGQLVELFNKLDEISDCETELGRNQYSAFQDYADMFDGPVKKLFESIRSLDKRIKSIQEEMNKWSDAKSDK